MQKLKKAKQAVSAAMKPASTHFSGSNKTIGTGPFDVKRSAAHALTFLSDKEASVSETLTEETIENGQNSHSTTSSPLVVESQVNMSYSTLQQSPGMFKRVGMPTPSGMNQLSVPLPNEEANTDLLEPLPLVSSNGLPLLPAYTSMNQPNSANVKETTCFPSGLANHYGGVSCHNVFMEMSSFANQTARPYVSGGPLQESLEPSRVFDPMNHVGDFYGEETW